jgi:hypothetical protein
VVVLGKRAQDSVLHPGTERLTVDLIVDVRIFGHEVVSLQGRERVSAGWQSEVHLDALVHRVGLQPVNPRLKCEGARRVVLDVLNGLGGGTFPRVVELSEEEVKIDFLQSVEDTCVGDHTLRGGTEKHVRVGLDVVAKDIVVLVEQIRTGNVPVVGLKVKIESVDDGVAERTRFARGSPLGSDRSVRSDQKLCEPARYICSRQSVVRWVPTTKGEQDLLTVLVAKVDAGLDTRAVALEIAGLSGSRVCVGLASTRIGMV